MLKIYLWLARKLFKKPFIEGNKIIYSAWEPKKDVRYFAPTDFSYGKPAINSSTFSKWQVERYLQGNDPMCFAQEEHALEAAKRILSALREYHEELKY